MYGTHEHYLAYYGAMEQAEFDMLNYRASMMIDVLTGQRAAFATGYKQARLDDCACTLINLMHANDSTSAGQGIASVSNDGYSESYQAVTPEDLQENLRQAAFNVLSGTGLMSAL